MKLVNTSGSCSFWFILVSFSDFFFFMCKRTLNVACEGEITIQFMKFMEFTIQFMLQYILQETEFLQLSAESDLTRQTCFLVCMNLSQISIFSIYFCLTW